MSPKNQVLISLRLFHVSFVHIVSAFTSELLTKKICRNQFFLREQMFLMIFVKDFPYLFRFAKNLRAKTTFCIIFLTDIFITYVQL